MSFPKLSKMELQVLEALWTKGNLSIREIQESFPARHRPVYTSVQTLVYRLEEKGAVRRAKKISNAHIFEAVLSREAASRSLIDDLLSIFGGRTEPVMAHLVESGKLTRSDVRDVERLIDDLDRKRKRRVENV